MENNTDGDYTHAKRFCEDFEIKIFDEYHDALLLADVFENF